MRTSRAAFINDTDLLHGPLMGKIFAFVMPLVVTNLIQNLYNAADMVVVGLSGVDGARIHRYHGGHGELHAEPVHGVRGGLQRDGRTVHWGKGPAEDSGSRTYVADSGPGIRTGRHDAGSDRRKKGPDSAWRPGAYP